MARAFAAALLGLWCSLHAHSLLLFFLANEQVVCRHSSQILPRVPNFALVPLSLLGEKRERIGYGPTFLREHHGELERERTSRDNHEGLITRAPACASLHYAKGGQPVGFNCPVRFGNKEMEPLRVARIKESTYPQGCEKLSFPLHLTGSRNLASACPPLVMEPDNIVLLKVNGLPCYDSYLEFSRQLLWSGARKKISELAKALRSPSPTDRRTRPRERAGEGRPDLTAAGSHPLPLLLKGGRRKEGRTQSRLYVNYCNFATRTHSLDPPSPLPPAAFSSPPVRSLRDERKRF